ncbi:hypothetical protein PWT90_01514 [Aphanocladium album]|nr:hypothetical protein PWT90_01514 [Aphanocladium album]
MVMRGNPDKFVDDNTPPPKSSGLVQTSGARLASQNAATRGSVTDWRQPPSQGSAQHQANLSSWDSYFDPRVLDGSQRAIALLRQFRYRTAPWLEAGDPEARFGVTLMQLAQEHEHIHTLVVELASSHLHSRFDGTRVDHATAQLSDGPQQLALVAVALKNLTERLCAEPAAWRHAGFQHSFANRELLDTDEPLRTLLRQQSRIGLAAAILTSTAPAPDSSIYLLHQISNTERNHTQSSAYDWILHHLTACLHLVFALPAASPEAIHVSPGSPDTFVSTGAPADWHNLWMRIQAWYDSQPVEMQSLVDIGSIERSQIDPLSSASFPIHLYSSAMAVQAATFYHISALLLLRHKPRLLHIPGRRQQFASPNWHARAIAGIVTSNEFPEQWDPIVISSLLYMARDATHAAQHRAILECLEKISHLTNIPLDNDAKQLQSQWAAASLGDSSLSR